MLKFINKLKKRFSPPHLLEEDEEEFRSIIITTNSPLIDNELQRQIYESFDLSNKAILDFGISAQECAEHFNTWAKMSQIQIDLSEHKINMNTARRIMNLPKIENRN